MSRITHILVGVTIFILLASSVVFAFSDEVKREAEKFVDSLNYIGITEEALREEGTIDLLIKKESTLREYFSKLSFNEMMLLELSRYFFSKETSYDNLCGLGIYRILHDNKWSKNLSKQEILLNKLFPIAVNREETNDLRIEVLHDIASYLDIKEGIWKELTPKQIEQVGEYLKQIVIDKKYHLSTEKKKYGDAFNVKTQAIDLLVKRFNIDKETLKQLLGFLDTEGNEWTKKRIIWGLSTAYGYKHIDAEGRKIFYAKLTNMAEHASKYNEDIQSSSFAMIIQLGGKGGLDFLYSLMKTANDTGVFQRIKIALDNYYSHSSQADKNEYIEKVRNILTQRINDTNSSIRKFCIEEISKETKELNRETKEKIRKLFLTAKQKEKDKELIKLLEKKIEELK